MTLKELYESIVRDAKQYFGFDENVNIKFVVEGKHEDQYGFIYDGISESEENENELNIHVIEDIEF